MSGLRARLASFDSADSFGLFNDPSGDDLSDMDLTTASPALSSSREPESLTRRISPLPSRATAPRTADRLSVILPRRNRSNVGPSDPRPSSHTMHATRVQNVQAGSSTPNTGSTRAAAIDLTLDDSDDDDPVVVGHVTRRAPAQPQPRNLPVPTAHTLRIRGARPDVIAPRDFHEEMRNIDRALDRHREETEALIEADQQDERRRLVLSPPANPLGLGVLHTRPARHNPRINFGGAVLRQGDQQINYEAGGARRQRFVPPPRNDENRIGRDLVQEGLPGPAGLLARTRTLAADRADRAAAFARTRRMAEIERAAARAQRQANDYGDPLWDDDPDDEDYDPANDEYEDLVAYNPTPFQPPRPPAAPRGPARPMGIIARLAEGYYGMPGLRNLFGVGVGAGQDDLLQRMQAVQDGAGPAALAGRAPGGVSAILDRVTSFHFTAAQPGFTSDFEDPADKEPITLNDEGEVVKASTKIKPYLSCAMCHDPLLNSSFYRSDYDRVWVLRCGHLVDQKCLIKLSTPEAPAESESEQPAPKKKVRRKVTKKVLPAVEHDYACPVLECDGKCTSVLEDAKWEQKLGEGALVAYV